MNLDIEDRLTVNRKYATEYQRKKEAEELSKLRDLHGNTASESSDLSSESEDEEGMWSSVTEAEFLRTLSLLKSKDPIIYDQNTTFYTDPEPLETIGQGSKAVYLRDYERERLLKKGSNADLSDSDEERFPHVYKEGNSHTYKEEQEELRAQFKMVTAELDGPLLTVRTKSKAEKAAEERDYHNWLKENAGSRDLEGLRAFWGNPLLSDGEQFLRDYILQQGHQEITELSVPLYEEVVGMDNPTERVVVSDSEDEAALEEQEDFERRFNFRFEEPEADLIKSYPRTITSSVRVTDNTRRMSRQQRQERKRQEKEHEAEELRRLKNLQRQEVQQRLSKLASVAGGNIDSLAANLDEDFDPESYDQSMSKVFGTEYYEGGGDEKPYIGDEELMEELHCEDPGFNMDADFTEEKPQTKKLKSKSRLKNSASAESADLPVREGLFKYRSVPANDFGLSTDEILHCDNKELNSWVSLTKMVQYRSHEEEEKDKKVFRKRAQNWSRKQRYLTSIYRPKEEAEPEDRGKMSKAKKKLKNASSKLKLKNTNSKLSKARLKSYGF